MGDSKACILPLIKIPHMLLSDGPIKSPKPPTWRGGAGSGAIKIECCALFALMFSSRRGLKIVEEIYWLPCKSQCKPITFPYGQPIERCCGQSV